MFEPLTTRTRRSAPCARHAVSANTHGIAVNANTHVVADDAVLGDERMADGFGLE
jgi:hypothetical protein